MPTCSQFGSPDYLAKIAAGWTIAGGPYPTLAACTANCGVASSSSLAPTPSSSVSPQPSSSVSPQPSSSVSAISTSATSRTSGTIATACCAGVLLPATLTATITSGGALDGSYPMSWNGITLQWSYMGDLGTCAGPATDRIVFKCTLGFLHLTTVGSVNIYNPFSIDCVTPDFLFVNVDLSGCGGTSNAQVEITS